MLHGQELGGINSHMATHHAPSGQDEEAEGIGLSVTVKVFGGLRQRLGGSGSTQVRLPVPPTLSSLLKALERTHGELVADLREGLDDGYLNVLINGRNMRFLGGFDSELSANDTVAFLPPVGGG